MANIFFTINKMYNGKDDIWNKTTDYEKSQAYFLLNRSMSMINPILAAEISRIKISTSGSMEYWQSILSKQYIKSPNCFYHISPKKKKKEKEIATNKYIPKNEIINYYCDLNKIDHATYIELENKYKNELYLELKELEENI